MPGFTNRRVPISAARKAAVAVVVGVGFSVAALCGDARAQVEVSGAVTVAGPPAPGASAPSVPAPAPPPAPAPVAAAPAPGARFGSGGGAGGQAPTARPATTPGQQGQSNYGYRQAQNYAQQARVVKGRAFYQNGNVWTDATVQSKQNVKQQQIKFNSDEYFALLREHPEAAAWLSLGNEVDVVLGDTLVSVR